MNPGLEPKFLIRVNIDIIHEDQINLYGGLHGVRDGGGDLYEIAAVYAYHPAESQSQAYFDGNKRTGVAAMLVFLEGHGIKASRISNEQTYEMMMKIAAHEAGRGDLADYLRSEFGEQGASAVQP